MDAAQKSPYVELLSYAVEAVGGVERLAACLRVDEARLSAWLSGEDVPPQELLMDALELCEAYGLRR